MIRLTSASVISRLAMRILFEVSIVSSDPKKVWARALKMMGRSGAKSRAFHQSVVNHGRQNATPMANNPPPIQLSLSVNWYTVFAPLSERADAAIRAVKIPARAQKRIRLPVISEH